jgi:hypothetical protein
MSAHTWSWKSFFAGFILGAMLVINLVFLWLTTG